MDLHDRSDILRLLRHFYGRVIPDAQIGHFFTQVVPLDLETHLPRLADFWTQILFGGSSYDGNPVQVHQAIHAKAALHAADFARWLMLWRESVDALYAGPVAELAKSRAETIAGVMQSRMQ
jgi:hemoglobin